MRALVLFLFIGIDFTMTNEYYDVVIIGCGSAGIGAAIELKSQSNLSFILLEARDRVGGRAYTDKDSFDFPFDIGAEWMHDFNPTNPLYSLHEQLKTDLDDDYYIRLFDPARIACFDSDGSKVSQEICAQAQETVQRLFVRKSVDVDEIDVSVKDAIREDLNRLEQGHFKRIVEAMLVAVEEIFAADLDQLSAKQYLNEPDWSIEVESGENLVVKRGYGSFERIIDHYRLPVALKTIVTQIDTLSHPNSVQVITSEERKIFARYAIITIPLGCLKERTINFEPALPQWKLDAIDQLGFGNTDKIIMQFDKVFWHENWTVIYLADARFPFALCSPDKRILSFMIGGRTAQTMEKENDEIIVAQVMSSLKGAFSEQQFQLEHHLISRWTADEFARGSYSFFKPNSSLETMNLLAKECAEYRLFWAGEHTSNGASVHTAFATGQREAQQILKHHHQNVLK